MKLTVAGTQLSPSVSIGVLKINSKHLDSMADARKGFISKLRVSSYVLTIISGNLLRITV